MLIFEHDAFSDNIVNIIKCTRLIKQFVFVLNFVFAVPKSILTISAYGKIGCNLIDISP